MSGLRQAAAGRAPAGTATPTGPDASLARALERQRTGLLPCVHCGFCLPACPTYRRLGDESDSPRGRLHLMRMVVEGRIAPTSRAFATHIDRCLGCRACEPVCPSGVEYGALLELARDVAARHRPRPWLTRALLSTFRRRWTTRLFMAAGRSVRGSGLAAAGGVLPAWGALRNVRLALAMLAASGPWRRLSRIPSGGGCDAEAGPPSFRGTVALLEGCVQAGLFARVNAATRRVLEANGYRLVEVPEQECCGALHAHGGALSGARELARGNVAAFSDAAIDHVVVNAAGCGAAMKGYDHLLAEDGGSGAAAVAGKVRDLTELLAEAGPRLGASLPMAVAYDAPCHLLHAQGIQEAPLAVLRAVPDLDVRVVPDAAECCGGAGIYGLTHPDLGGRIGDDKVRSVLETGAEVVATANPGCMMQIGAGLRLRGADVGVVHPVELLDESYRRAGYYDDEPRG